MITRQQLIEITSKFANIHALVIGDLMLDVYLKGQSTRLTPEAPVPVVDIDEKKTMLGGAGNTACNLRHLGATVTVCSVVGDDEPGNAIIKHLQDLQIGVSGVVRERQRKSLVKTRVVASGHVITRFDEGDATPIEEETVQQVQSLLAESFAGYDVVILSDYNKGLFTKSLLAHLASLVGDRKIPVLLDSKRLPFFNSLRVTVAKPNYHEAIAIAELPCSAVSRNQQIEEQREMLLAKINAENMLVTLDTEGSLLLTENGESLHHPAYNIDKAHVSGAGDTFLSAAALTLIASHDIRTAQEVATASAAIAVSKSETSYCTIQDLFHFFPSREKILNSLNDLAKLCEMYRGQGKKIVLTNGCFDILHSGHVTYLHCAKDLGDILIVGMNNDASIRRLKGRTRPINTLDNRMKVISSLYAVDHVVEFGNELDDTPIELVKAIKPDVFVKGGDYTKDRLPEAKAVEDIGGRIVFIPVIPNQSTTLVIEKITSTKAYDKVESN